MPSGMGGLLRTNRRQVLQQPGADFRAAAAAVPQQEHRHRAKLLEVSAIDDRAASALRADQARSGQHRKVRRHRVVQNSEFSGDLTGRQALGLMCHQQPKDVEPGRLRESSEAQDGSFFLHVSGTIDISRLRQRRDANDK